MTLPTRLRPAPRVLATREVSQASTLPGSDLSAQRRTTGPRPGYVLAMIVAVTPIGQMAIDVYAPSLPTLARAFDVGQGAVAASVTAYLVAFAVGMLLHGPLADVHGRRPVLLAGLGLFAIGSLAAMLAPSIGVFVLARVVQGLGISAAPVVMRVMATDVFEGRQLHRALTYLVVSYGLGPIVAPVIGAQLADHLGWRSCLGFLLLYGAALAVLAWRGPETLRGRGSQGVRMIARSAAATFADPTFVATWVGMGLISGVVYSFNVVAPFLVEQLFGHGAATFSLVALAMGGCYLVGTLSNRALPDAVSARARSVAGAVSAAATAVAMVVAGRRSGRRSCS